MKYLGNPYSDIYLTPREVDTIKALIHGETNKEAAERLGLSVRTIESYVKNIRSKLSCMNKKDTIRKVLQSELGRELYNSVLD